VSGFAEKGWAAVEVQEVWMPWTEDPRDPEARRIRTSQAALAAQLTIALAPNPALAPYSKLAANALSNEAAMRTLHDGFAGTPRRRFLPGPNREAAHFETPALPGIGISVLGPSRVESVIRDMDPPAGRSYLRQGAAVTTARQVPFSSDWIVETDNLSAVVHFKLSDKDKKAVARAGAGQEDRLAVALDKAVNGTSLMVVLQVGTTCLLFPGDAQWGSWQAVMMDPEWRDLLGRISFYKVGHHGSHNATPVEFVEKIVPQDFFGMVSVAHVDQWPSIPRPPLLKALSAKTARLVRSDKLKGPLPFEFKKGGIDFVDVRIPIS
jgi:hypothetical protein